MCKYEQMPYRLIAARELGHLFGILSHPDRVRLIEELRGGELDVGTLQERLGISHSRVSQHLSLLRAARLVEERRQGRQVFYHLRSPALSRWILEGLQFVEAEMVTSQDLMSAVQEARTAWSDPARKKRGKK